MGDFQLRERFRRKPDHLGLHGRKVYGLLELRILDASLHDGIDLPLGSYVPVFRRCALDTASAHQEEAREQDASQPRPALHEFLLFLAAYLANDAESAARYAALITSENDPLGLMARALVAAHRGETDAAKEMLDRLAASGPLSKA